MKSPASMRGLENLGRVRLSRSFFMRDFLHSEIGSFYGIPNIPNDPDLAIEAGKHLATELLEPLQDAFGPVRIRGAYRCAKLNAFGNMHNLNCANNIRAGSRHVWDRRDKNGKIGAMACIVVPHFADLFATGTDWRAFAWWMHDHLPYSSLYFYPKMAAFNIGWHEAPVRRIDSYLAPKGCLTKPGMANHAGRHNDWYDGILN
ncbi:MAG: hypothetical protein EP348_07890 [Alphaproteobacteria bacterium]|nr:MAG: hypothetical protein EP348_07890 [Alphaproteobacteria bacterium]